MSHDDDGTWADEMCKRAVGDLLKTYRVSWTYQTQQFATVKAASKQQAIKKAKAGNVALDYFSTSGEKMNVKAELDNPPNSRKPA